MSATASESSASSGSSGSAIKGRFQDDPRFKQGLGLVKEKKYEEALDFWSPIMQAV